MRLYPYNPFQSLTCYILPFSLSSSLLFSRCIVIFSSCTLRLSYRNTLPPKFFFFHLPICFSSYDTLIIIITYPLFLYFTIVPCFAVIVINILIISLILLESAVHCCQVPLIISVTSLLLSASRCQFQRRRLT